MSKFAPELTVWDGATRAAKEGWRVCGVASLLAQVFPRPHPEWTGAFLVSLMDTSGHSNYKTVDNHHRLALQRTQFPGSTAPTTRCWTKGPHKGGQSIRSESTNRHFFPFSAYLRAHRFMTCKVTSSINGERQDGRVRQVSRSSGYDKGVRARRCAGIRG